MSTRRWFWVSSVVCLAPFLLVTPAGGQTPSPRLHRATPVPERGSDRRPARPRLDIGFIPTAELAVGTSLAGDPNHPQGTGEFQVVFRETSSVKEEALRQDHVWVPFRWSTQVSGVAGVQWQVVTNPMTLDLVDWEYPVGIVARGRVSSVPSSAGAQAFFVVDFKPIFELPAGFSLSRPRPVPRSSAESGAVRGGPSATGKPLRMPGQLFDVAPSPSPSRGRRMSGLNSRFAEMTAAVSQQRWRFVRIVPVGADGQPVGVSGYVSVRLAAEEGFVVYPELLPTPVPPAPEVKAPDLRVVRYTGPSFPPGDPSGRYIVLGNVPEIFTKQFGWTPGKPIHLQPNQSKGALEAIGDAIDSAFSSLGDLVDWFSETWDKLKEDFIRGICGGNATCADVAGPVLDAGLAAMGVPPEIPNFNELCGLGADYLAAYVVSQSPIPISEEVVRAGLVKMADLVNNPPGGSGGAFLWPDPAYQEKPAMVTVEVHNPRSEPSDPIVVRLAYGDNDGQVSPYPNLATYLDSITEIPSLSPNETMTIPIVLTVNVDITISHGNDSLSDYFSRNIQIYRLGFDNPLIFTSKENWWAHDVTE